MLMHYGDIVGAAVRGEFEVLIHSCNCFHSMDSGASRLIKSKFSEAFEADLKTVSGSRDKLGTFSMAKVGELVIANAYTQFNCGIRQTAVDYDSIRACMRSAAKLFPGKRIGMPKICASQAGEAWSNIENIIRQELTHEYVMIMYM